MKFKCRNNGEALQPHHYSRGIIEKCSIVIVYYYGKTVVEH